MKHRLICSLLATCAASLPIFSQEALKSTEEEYYDYLSLQGLAERPTLGYRTLSDNEWILTDEAKTADENVWKNNSLGSKWTVYEPAQKTDNIFTRGIDQSVKVKIYGPEWYNSYNTAAPYGQNDGALWQGKGYNTSFTAGARLEAYGLEATFKPQLSFSQNREFDYIIDNRMQSSVYSDKADTYGYLWGVIDAPQRFGDKTFFTYDWGDTEIRYTWHNLTTGVGTQTIWLGPAWLNPLLHSNNAPSYPKFDIGLRKTPVHLPWLGWYVGDVEGRMWIGYLTESDYFDNSEDNNHNRINGFYFSYAPFFLPNFSLGITKVCLSKWNSFEFKYLNPFYDSNSGIGEKIGEDQKMSFYADLIVPKGGIEIYGEIGLDDYLQGGWIEGLSRYPFDTLIWTLGIKKSVNISSKYNIYGEIILELSDMEQGRNKVSDNASYSFNSHYQITQGYTNQGQYIGTYLANGGNSQTLIFNLYYPKGLLTLTVRRGNPDDTYSYINLGNDNQTYKGYLLTGLSNTLFITKNFSFDTGVIYQKLFNSMYFVDNGINVSGTKTLQNFIITLGAKYNF